MRLARILLSCCLVFATQAGAKGAAVVDHHQHLVNVSTAESPDKAIDARKLATALDEAGIARAVLLSNAFLYGNPRATPLADEYERVKAENDWTLAEALQYPQRFVVFCSFNPLRDYALAELERCAKDRRFGRGIKLQFGASDVNLDDEADVDRVRRVFDAANDNGMAIVVHMRTRRARPYGRVQAQIVIDKLLSAAPDVPVQIAHFTGGGNPDDAAADEALAVFIEAIRQRDRRVKNLYFDTALIVNAADTVDRKDWIAQRIREIGLERVLYGSDGGDPTDPPPNVQLRTFRSLPLSKSENAAIEKNVAPYLRRR